MGCRALVHLLVAAVTVLSLTAGAMPRATAASPNLVQNPGFENAIPSEAAPVQPPASVGNWTRYRQLLFGGNVDTVASPVHGGAMAARVQGTASASNAAGHFYQNFPSFPVQSPRTSFELSFWVYPDLGTQSAALLYNWDHFGNADAATEVLFSETQTAFRGWGFSTPVTGPPLSYDTWHQVRLQANACTGIVQIVVDGTTNLTTPPGTPPAMPTATATVLLGQLAGAVGVSQSFYYDDVSLTTAACDAVNLIQNPGFEDAIPSEAAPTRPPASVGNWTRYHQVSFGGNVDTVNSPAHGGTLSARVQGTAAASNAAGYFYQDLPSFPVLSPPTSFELSFWVYPDFGTQSAALLYNWDHFGNADAAAEVRFTETQTEFRGWGFSTPVTGPPLSYDTWHQVQLLANTCTGVVQILVDGTTNLTTPPGTPPTMPTATATVLLGQLAGAVSVSQSFYYDDVSLTTTSCSTARPRISVNAVAAGGGRLQVTIASSTVPAAPGNRLTQVRAVIPGNARIDVPNGPQDLAGEVNLPIGAGTQPVVFFVRRIGPGAIHVPLSIADTYGPWPSFVGGGPNAF